MKYKLLKDLPWAKAGTTCKGFCDDFSTYYINIPNEGSFGFPEATFSDWFEEVDERWKPKQSEYYYFIAANSIECVKWCDMHQGDKALYEAGNCFRTRELAEQAAEQIKALLKEFHKNNP